jgi:uncharacterized lipoprotein
MRPFALSLSKCMSVAAVLLLAACASNPPEPRMARYPQAADMQPCPPLEKPADGTLASLYRSHVSAAHQYHACRARHDNLVEWVKRGIDAGHQAAE